MPWDAQEDLVMASKRSLGTGKGSNSPVCPKMETYFRALPPLQ